ncbi:MAG: hypothetical protein R3261_13060 [Alphaproteobacteria bacterium]|nr:hypothetical protein [Alphaproteobacteria bacterium]
MSEPDNDVPEWKQRILDLPDDEFREWAHEGRESAKFWGFFLGFICYMFWSRKLDHWPLEIFLGG